MVSEQNLVKLISENQEKADCYFGLSIQSLIIHIYLQSLQNEGFSASYCPQCWGDGCEQGGQKPLSPWD